jgi:hypothetical protein
MLNVIANSEEHRYQNIFGGQNTYDQVMSQVNQNIASTKICENPLESESEENKTDDQNLKNLA